MLPAEPAGNTARATRAVSSGIGCNPSRGKLMAYRSFASGRLSFLLVCPTFAFANSIESWISRLGLANEFTPEGPLAHKTRLRGSATDTFGPAQAGLVAAVAAFRRGFNR